MAAGHKAGDRRAGRTKTLPFPKKNYGSIPPSSPLLVFKMIIKINLQNRPRSKVDEMEKKTTLLPSLLLWDRFGLNGWMNFEVRPVWSLACLCSILSDYGLEWPQWCCLLCLCVMAGFVCGYWCYGFYFVVFFCIRCCLCGFWVVRKLLVRELYLKNEVLCIAM